MFKIRKYLKLCVLFKIDNFFEKLIFGSDVFKNASENNASGHFLVL